MSIYKIIGISVIVIACLCLFAYYRLDKIRTSNIEAIKRKRRRRERELSRRRKSAELRLAVKRSKDNEPRINLVVKNPSLEEVFEQGMTG